MNHFFTKLIIGSMAILFFVACEDSNTLCLNETNETNNSSNAAGFTYHHNIQSTLVWVGENNDSSAWDNNWTQSYGGVDAPEERDNYHPVGFTPKENPFYISLPYNDLDAEGKRKLSSALLIPWASDSDAHNLSICKNRWIKIDANNKTAYAQWEEAGPYSSSDSDYVFGTQKPASGGVGIGISPALRDYLDLETNATVDWVFVDEDALVDGPWSDIVTTSKSNP